MVTICDWCSYGIVLITFIRKRIDIWCFCWNDLDIIMILMDQYLSVSHLHVLCCLASGPVWSSLVQFGSYILWRWWSIEHWGHCRGCQYCNRSSDNHTFCGCHVASQLQVYTMTSSNGNIFRVTGHLCGEFTCHRWIPLTKASDAELWCFLWSTHWINRWVNNREAGDLRRHRTHHDITVMVENALYIYLCECIPHILEEIYTYVHTHTHTLNAYLHINTYDIRIMFMAIITGPERKLRLLVE